MCKLPLDTIRIPLLIARIERDYAHSEDTGLSCGPRKILVADDNVWAASKGIHVFHFGAVGTCHVLAFGHLEDALEDAAAVLPKGYFSEPDYEDVRQTLELQLADERRQASAKLFCSTYGDLSEGQQAEVAAYLGQSEVTDEQVWEEAEMDLTYTESGHLASWEWTVSTFDSLDELRAFAANK
jgi:hypothetical protein